MIDVPLAAFLLATCLAACYLLESDNKRRMRAAVCCGVLAGFAGLVKINGLLIGVGLVLTVLVLRLSRFGVRQALVLGSACLVTSVAVGYLFTPNYWPQFKDIQPAAVRAEISAFRINGFPAGSGGDDGRFAAFNATYPQLANLTRPLRLPLLFIRWKLFLDSLIRLNPGWAIEEPRPVTQVSQLFGTYASFPGQGFLVLLGFVILVRQILSNGPGRFSDVAVVVIAFFVVNYSLILFLQRLAWDRYYLPTVMSYQIPAALAVIRMGEWAKGRRPKARHSERLATRG
jgi:hypothetical protein